MVKAALESVPEQLRAAAGVSFCPEISPDNLSSLYSQPEILLSLYTAFVGSAAPPSSAIPDLSDEDMWHGFDPTQRQRARQLMIVSRRGIIISLLAGVALIFLNTIEDVENDAAAAEDPQ